MADGMIGHIKEKLVVPEHVETYDRRGPTGSDSTPFGTDDPSGVPEMPRFGEGHNLLVTGSTHRPTGVRDYAPIHHQRKVKRIREKILGAEEIADTVAVDMEDAEIAVISFGAAARPCYGAVKKARDEGVRVGLLRPRTIWPFPERLISSLADQVRDILVVEMNVGKYVREVERVACGRADVHLLSRIGGVLPMVGEISQAIGRMA